MASVVGIILLVVLSASNGLLAILTRQMQELPVSVMITYIALAALLLLGTGLLIEFAFSVGPLRIVNYDAEQYMFGFLAGGLNQLGLLFKIIAYQNERSGLITLLAYIGLVYAFLGDYFLFDERLSAMEIIGILLILLINVGLVVKKMTGAKENEKAAQTLMMSSIHGSSLHLDEKKQNGKE